LRKGSGSGIIPYVALEEQDAKEDISTEKNPPEAHAWLSGEDEHTGRTYSLKPEATSRSAPVDGIGWRYAIGMRKAERLTRSSQFAAVFKHGNTRADSLMVLRSMPNGLDLSRFGFVVSKKVGGAVVRNRVRRRLREAARLMHTQPGWDIVIIGREKIAQASYRGVEKALMALLTRARLLGRG